MVTLITTLDRVELQQGVEEKGGGSWCWRQWYRLRVDGGSRSELTPALEVYEISNDLCCLYSIDICCNTASNLYVSQLKSLLMQACILAKYLEMLISVRRVTR